MRWVLIFFLLVTGNVLAWVLGIHGYLERRIGRFERELINRHYEEVDSVYRQMRGWRHDYHNHIQALKVCLSEKEYGQMEDYLNQLDHSLGSVDQLVKTGNLMLDAILNSKLSMIRQEGILVDAAASVPPDMPFRAIDLCVLLGNLLDNAMEACRQMDEGERRFIRVYMDTMKGQLYLCVTNSMRGNAVRRGNGYLSTKQGGHGFGLGRIDRIVEQYDGFLNRQSEEGVFSTEVMLPLS